MLYAFRTWGIACLALATAAYGASTSEDFGFRLIPLAAQVPVAPGEVGQTGKLLITVIDGEGAVNNIKARTAREPVVEVTDENHKPVAGAAVTFFVPGNGPGGAFAGKQSITVLSDHAGRAVAQGFHPNAIAGQFRIDVTATYGNQIAKTTIAQSNLVSTSAASSAASTAAHAGGLSTKVIVILAAVGAAGTAGIVYGVTHNGNSTPTATIGAPGSVTVGAPH